MFTSKLGTSDSQLGLIELGLLNQAHSLSISDTLTFSPSLSVSKVGTDSVSDTLTLSQSFILNGLYSRSISQSLSFSPSFSYVKVEPIFQSLSFSQVISYDLYSSVTTSKQSECFHDLLEFIETIVVDKAKHVRQSLNFFQGCINYDLEHRSRVYSRSISQALTFSQAPTSTKASVLHETLSQSFSFSQLQSATNNAIDKSISDTVSFSPALSSHVTVAIPLSLSHSLSFSSSPTNRTVRPRSISHSLSFSQSFPYHRTTFGVLRQSFSLSSSLSRNIVSRHSLSDFLNLSLPPVLYLSYANPIILPNPDIIVVRNQPFFIYLQSDYNQIYLPAPLFDDSESGLNSVSIKRSMAGGSRSYVHSSRNVRFRYSFSLSRQQSYNLQEFIVRTNAKSIFLLNWKYEKYVGYITTNPLTIVEKRVWDNVTDLEFQGVRI